MKADVRGMMYEGWIKELGIYGDTERRNHGVTELRKGGETEG